MGMDIEQLPAAIRNSKVLSKEELSYLVTVGDVPAVNPAFDDSHVKQIIQYYSLTPEEMEIEFHLYAKKLLAQGKIEEAWQVLLGA